MGKKQILKSFSGVNYPGLNKPLCMDGFSLSTDGFVLIRIKEELGFHKPSAKLRPMLEKAFKMVHPKSCTKKIELSYLDKFTSEFSQLGYVVLKNGSIIRLAKLAKAFGPFNEIMISDRHEDIRTGVSFLAGDFEGIIMPMGRMRKDAPVRRL